MNVQYRISCRLMGLKQAAEYLSISYWTLRSLIWRGDLPSVRVCRRILIDREDLEEFISKNKTTESF
jgi:excisionase family DNA binding protein